MPVTWDALLGDPRYGDGLLRATIDTVKDATFGAVVAPAAEANYPLIVIDYVAKKVALQLINPGIDLWQREPVTVSATGTNENTTYVNPVDALKMLRESLLAETKAMWGVVGPLVNFARVSSAAIPVMNTINDELLTPSPQEFGRPYRVTDRS
jgi:hypothetical protein